MEKFKAIEWIAIDIASKYGLDKETLERRLEFGNSLKEELKSVAALVFLNPATEFEDVKKFNDFAEKYLPGFYNDKVKQPISFEDLSWNCFSQNPVISYENIITLRRKIQSGEYDKELRKIEKKLKLREKYKKMRSKRKLLLRKSLYARGKKRKK